MLTYSGPIESLAHSTATSTHASTTVRLDVCASQSPVMRSASPFITTDIAKRAIVRALAVTRDLQAGEKQESRAAANQKTYQKPQEDGHSMLLVPALPGPPNH